MKRMSTSVVQKDRFLVLERSYQQQVANENQSQADQTRKPDMAAKPTYSYLQAGPKFCFVAKKRIWLGPKKNW